MPQSKGNIIHCMIVYTCCNYTAESFDLICCALFFFFIQFDYTWRATDKICLWIFTNKQNKTKKRDNRITDSKLDKKDEESILYILLVGQIVNCLYWNRFNKM